MSSSKSIAGSDDLGESWVEVGSNNSHGPGTPNSVTRQLTAEDYLRLLKEAQDSNQSSCRASVAGSRRGSPRSSPKSPPNSPVVQGGPFLLDWQSYYMNPDLKEEIFDTLSWSSRPDSTPKPWSFSSSNQKYDALSLRYAKIGNTPLFSKRGLCIVFLTNLFSLIFGTGVGIFLNRHGAYFSGPEIKFR